MRYTMRNPVNMLSSLEKHSSNLNYAFERLYRNLYNRDLFLLAYQNIYAAEGNMTKGVDGKTIDGMSLKRIDKLIEKLKDESYQPNPSRRVYIPKKSGKMRPLGIPSFDDKLVQEVLRMLLEAIYENSFEKTSHGFRPNKSCHTALNQIQVAFTGAKWFIEGDIKGFFDNIDHNKMIEILSLKIKDERFLRLIRKFLNAGYLEDWTYHKTYSGTPQGGIISPILANIYLDRLDKFINEVKKSFDKGKYHKTNPQATVFERKRKKLMIQLENVKTESEKAEIIKQIKLLEHERFKVPYIDPFDKNFRRIQYTRYADDFLIGIIGNKEDAKEIKSKIKEFLSDTLKLELSEEKTLITHSQKKAHFLGYDIYVRRTQAAKRNKNGDLKRAFNGKIALEVPINSIKKKLLDYGAMTLEVNVYGKEVWRAKSRYFIKDNDDLEILDQYNSEIRGLRNYYAIANNSAILNSFGYIMCQSLFKTYGTKYRCSMKKAMDKFRIGSDFGIKFTAKGKSKVRLFYNEGFARKIMNKSAKVDIIPNTVKYASKTSLIDRLKAEKCELCGKTDCAVEIHHVRKLKDLSGKSYWEKFMIARNRKTLALCEDCHEKLHSGKLN